MAKLLLATVLSLLALTTFATDDCSLVCQSEYDLSVGNKCVVAVPDLYSYNVYSYDTDKCEFVSQSVTGGYLPVGDETVKITVKDKNTQEEDTCEVR